jgi:diadenylate cyclase
MDQQLRNFIPPFGLIDLLDVLIVAFVLYKLYGMIKDTRAVTLLKGLLVILVAALLSNWLHLNALYWLLGKTLTVVAVALPVVFQPELRRALEHIGRGRFFSKSRRLNEEEMTQLCLDLAKTAVTLSRTRTGALIVVERETGLNDYVESGIRIDGIVSSELLINCFIPNTPLHDGALIIRGNRVMAAGCLLPLTERSGLDKELGTRHRAAIGLSEQTDAIVIVVSEETGLISIALGGQLERNFDFDSLKTRLETLFVPIAQGFSDYINRRNGRQ